LQRRVESLNPRNIEENNLAMSRK